MKASSQVEYQEEGGKITLKLSGYINHFVEIDVKRLKNFKNLDVNFEGVTMINSLGIKKWFEVLNQIGTDVSIKYHQIPPSVVTQMSLVVGFLPKNAEVISFFAPYFDKSTKETKMILLTPDQVKAGKAPVQTNDLGEELILDAIEEIYFSFLEKKSA